MYHSSESRGITRYLLPGALALAFAFGIVGLYRGDIDMQGLAANVTNVSRGQQYDADLIVTRNGKTLEVVLGANADGVDSVDFTLLSDPTRLQDIASTAPSVIVTAQKELGTYRVSITTDGKNVRAGTKLTTLGIEVADNTPLALTDAAFVSGEDRYNLTSKVQ